MMREVLSVRLARLVALLVIGACGLYSECRLPVPHGNFLQLGGRNPITTPNSLRDGVLRFDASTGSFLCNHGITLASSTVEGRASSCHIVGRASDTILLRVLAPVPLATCTLFTGYLIEYALLMRFLAHHWGGCGHTGWSRRWRGSRS